MLERVIYFIGWTLIALGITTTTSDAIIVPALMVLIGFGFIKAVEHLEEGRK